jgi:hypothetical protein
MANKVTMSAEFTGVEAVLKALLGGTPLAKKIARKTFIKFARETREDFRASAPEGATKKLRRSIKARSTRGGGAQVYGDRKVAPHTHFRDAGTKDRKTKKGQNRGKVEGTHWIKKAQERAKARFESSVTLPLVAELKQQLGRE